MVPRPRSQDVRGDTSRPPEQAGRIGKKALLRFNNCQEHARRDTPRLAGYWAPKHLSTHDERARAGGLDAGTYQLGTAAIARGLAEPSGGGDSGLGRIVRAPPGHPRQDVASCLPRVLAADVR